MCLATWQLQSWTLLYIFESLCLENTSLCQETGPWRRKINFVIWLCFMPIGGFWQVSKPPWPICNMRCGTVHPLGSYETQQIQSSAPEQALCGSPCPQPWKEKHLPCQPLRYCPDSPPAHPHQQEWPGLWTGYAEIFILFTWTFTMEEIGLRNILFGTLMSHQSWRFGIPTCQDEVKPER